MNASGQKFTDAKEIARLTNLTVRQVYKNRDRLGLTPFMVRLNTRVIQFRRVAAIRALEKVGYVMRED